MITVEGVTHWSIGVNDLEESERFYGDFLGLTFRGRLGNSNMSCFSAGREDILLCQRESPLRRTPKEDNRLHQAFTVSPENWERAVRLLAGHGVELAEPIVYREHGFFTGRELYILDPSGNIIELRDPTWQAGMPTPTYEQILEGDRAAVR